MTDSGECGLNQIAGVDTLTMLGGKVEECHDFGSILLQGRRRPRVFGLIGFDEQIEGLLRILFGLGLPNVVDRGFGLWP